MMKMFSSTVRYQAEAVRQYLGYGDGLECSWCDEEKIYKADPEIAEWHNGREQGYVVTMRSSDYKRQINIAFFEHRNSDRICAVMWEQTTLNPPTIDTAEFGDVYNDKYDVSHAVNYGQASEMAAWIYDQLEEFWKKTNTQTEKETK